MILHDLSGTSFLLRLKLGTMILSVPYVKLIVPFESILG